jgi:hypothetical protein
MKPQVKKWTFNPTVTGLFISALLVGVVLNPNLTYANKTIYNNFTIFHNKPIDGILLIHLDEATEFIKKSELYNPKLKLDICLNDGSLYPSLIQKFFGLTFAEGFYNKVVLHGNADYKDNFIEINGYKWNLTQALAHEAVHCLQFDKLGLWKSNPMAKIPTWKWEGYPEYVARQNPYQKDIVKNIGRLIKTEQTDNNGWIQFADSTGAVLSYYKYWLLVQYCMDIRKMTYMQILNDTAKEETVELRMMDWYKIQASLPVKKNI